MKIHPGTIAKLTAAGQIKPGSEVPLDLKLLVAAVVSNGFPPPEPEYKFHESRKWRFDLCWVEYGVAFEREGGTYVQVSCKQCGKKTSHFRSRHHDQHGMEDDIEKYNAAETAGWRVIRATTPMMRDGRAVTAILAALEEAALEQRSMKRGE